MTLSVNLSRSGQFMSISKSDVNSCQFPIETNGRSRERPLVVKPPFCRAGKSSRTWPHPFWSDSPIKRRESVAIDSKPLDQSNATNKEKARLPPIHRYAYFPFILYNRERNQTQLTQVWARAKRDKPEDQSASRRGGQRGEPFSRREKKRVTAGRQRGSASG